MPNVLLDLALPVLAVLALVWMVWLGRRRLEGSERLERDLERLLENSPTSKPSPRVIDAVRHQFSDADQPVVLDLLSRYGATSSAAGRERVHLAILKLSEGSAQQVRENVKLALLDYRDVLYSAESRN